ncbi:PRC-barrel domain containing protein [Salipiger sp. IMCC34102]|uniref:PRC-barrel domain-containing protein n=1 Tax=Salipiger sp. IMCC34102 TaxID=2510647 RepID=UPI00101B67D0|nr:PRC-barrel domain-containing protein [Salipiger sp. IMCC34102]RYH01224.1 PRC-barrel domain containing protein [Salipiger sp. IMCC34102]
MKNLIIGAMMLPLATAASAQSADLSGYMEADDIKVVDAAGERIGEVETVLINASGMPAALVVEVDDGFLDLGDREVVVEMDALTWDNGQYTTAMTPEEMENLPVWDD